MQKFSTYRGLFIDRVKPNGTFGTPSADNWGESASPDANDHSQTGCNFSPARGGGNTPNAGSFMPDGESSNANTSAQNLQLYNDDLVPSSAQNTPLGGDTAPISPAQNATLSKKAKDYLKAINAHDCHANTVLNANNNCTDAPPKRL